MEATFVSMIISTFKQWERLFLNLQAFSKQSYLDDLFEVIVVNNDAENRRPVSFSMHSQFQ